jgi:hypothetical protein
MANIQKYFIQFHDAIRLADENEILREKRDIVLDKLKTGLAQLREDGVTVPSFSSFGQGSYSMGTGTVPLDRDYDIDHGIVFDLTKSDYDDPVEVKEWVYKALDGHTDRVELRRSCVTVYYHRDGESEYHVDLAVYACAEKNGGTLYLAKGKLQSTDEHRVWEASDPRGLIEKVKTKFAGDDGRQFRRVIRYVKRWKDVRFPTDGNGAPTGIALTVLALEEFAIVKTQDPVANTVAYDDLASLERLLPRILARFSTTWTSEDGLHERLKVTLPVLPHNDLLARMTANQMATLKSELEDLLEAIRDAANDIDEHSACKAMRKKLGDDFPVPDKSETAERRARAVTSGGSSA